MMMPRTIDKIRASMPGGNLGPYHIAPGMSAILLATLGVSLEHLTDVVTRAANEDDIVKWLRLNAHTSQYPRANALISAMRGQDLPEEHRSKFEAMYPEHLRKRCMNDIDLIEADDKEMFAGS